MFKLLCEIFNGYLPFIYFYPCLPHTKVIFLELLQNTTKKQKRIKSFKFCSISCSINKATFVHRILLNVKLKNSKDGLTITS